MWTSTNDKIKAIQELQQATAANQALAPRLQAALDSARTRRSLGICTKEEINAYREFGDATNEFRYMSNSTTLDQMTLTELKQLLEAIYKAGRAGEKFININETACREEISSGENASPGGPQQERFSEAEAYAMLGVKASCTDEELRTAYRGKARQWHPDNFHSMEIPKQMKELAEKEMAKINKAYETLTKFRSIPSASER